MIKQMVVMTTGGTKKEYEVDVWSGNHPFYLGNHSAMLVDADQVEKFRKKSGELSQIMKIPVLKAKLVILSRRKGGINGGRRMKTVSSWSERVHWMILKKLVQKLIKGPGGRIQ